MGSERPANRRRQGSGESRRSEAKAGAGRHTRIPGAAYLLIVLVVVFSLFGEGFATLPNLLNIGVQGSVLLLLALPMTLIIMCEGIDLSMGAVLSLSGVVLATLLMNGHGLVVALAAAAGVGLAFGVA